MDCRSMTERAAGFLTSGGDNEAAGVYGTGVTDGGGIDTFCEQGRAEEDQCEYTQGDDCDGRRGSLGATAEVAGDEGGDGGG